MADLSGDIPRFITEPPRQICQSDGRQSTVAQFCFGKDFIGFQGHFPENPVVPGIVQIMLAQYTAASGRHSALVNVIKCKFISQIKPDDCIEVCVDDVPDAATQHNTVQHNTTPHNMTQRYKGTVLANGVRSATLLFELQYQE